MNLLHKVSLIRLYSLSVSLWFFGRACQHLFWETPYREFFWNGRLLEGIVNAWFNLSWNEYMVHPSTNAFIDGTAITLGVLYLSNSIICWLAPYYQWARWSGLINLVLFLPFIWLNFQGYWFNSLQILEFALQVGSIFFFFHLCKQGKGHLFKKQTRLLLKLLIALTFTAHGLYAMGVFPLPQNFIQMTISALNVNNETAILFLWWAGFMDILLSVLIFTPFRIAKYALIYAIVWGFLTAFARIYCNVYMFDFWNGLNQWHYHFLVRNAHFIIPTIVYMSCYRSKHFINHVFSSKKSTE